MKTAKIATIVEDASSGVTTKRLGRVLDFLGIPWETISSSGDASDAYHAVLAPLPTASEFWRDTRLRPTHSAFFYPTADARASSLSLGALTGSQADVFLTPGAAAIDVVVSKEWSALMGPLHGLTSTVKVRASDHVAAIGSDSSASSIISTERGSAFFCCEKNGSRAFVSCSSEIPDLDEPLSRKGYDIREQFLSVVPLLTYLKWAFRDVCWRANEIGACLIVDDPVLRTKYGFCDFPLLDARMQEHSFTTNIAMIPWNRRRTSPAMASLVKKSGGRLSVSVHGCDHTAREFGIANPDELNAKVHSANERMEEHRKITGVAHDAIMVFPQGIFSRESLRTLQQNGFVAAVNTEAFPFAPAEENLTTRDAWAVAINKYGSFPLFTRRYPADGLENFAFDILLGKPCLVVEHHGFFKGEHQKVVAFVQALNALNGGLRWRSLGDVIKRSYQWRLGADGVVRVRMFANQLLLENAAATAREYRIEKADEGSAGVSAVTANGESLEWQTDGYSIVFKYQIPSGAEILIQVQYKPAEKTRGRLNGTPAAFVKIAARRYLSEFRDNFLSRHDGLMAIAQKAKRMARGKS